MIATSTRATRDPLFLDTGFLIALNAADDQYHQRAVEQWRSIGRATPLVTTTYIVDEVVTYFSNRGRHPKAVAIGTLLNRPDRLKSPLPKRKASQTARGFNDVNVASVHPRG